MFAYDALGRFIVLVDGSEVLVHDGDTEAPLWRQAGAANLVGVASIPQAIVTLDTQGLLCWYMPDSGEVLTQRTLDVAATALAVTDRGLCAVGTQEGVLIVEETGEPTLFGALSCTAVAWSANGNLAIGTAQGEILIFDSNGAVVDQAKLKMAVHTITWHIKGFWVVGAGDALLRLDDEALARITTLPDGLLALNVACARCGDIAVQVGENMILVLEYPSRETNGTFIYEDRIVNGVAFGPNDWIGIGLEGGDGNKIDMVTGATCRTDTHAGREHHSWSLMVSANRTELAEDLRPEEEMSDDDESGDVILGTIILIAILAGLYFLFF